MPAPNPIIAAGTIVACRRPRIYDALLPNGKPVVAHVPPRLAAALGELEPGARVRLELTHYDFSTARIGGLYSQGEGEAEGRAADTASAH